MNGKTTLISAIVLLILACIYVYGEISKKETAIKEKEEKKIFSITPEEINRVSIGKKDGYVIFEKQDGIWNISSPQKFTAKSWEFENMLYLLSDLKKEEEIPAENLKDFGLQPPNIILTLSGKEREETIEIGKRNYNGNLSYAKKLDQNSIFTVSSILIGDLERPYSFFIEDSPLPIDLEKAEEIRVKTENNTTLLSKREDIWEMEGDGMPKQKADPKKATLYLQSITSLRVRDIKQGSLAPDAPKSYKAYISVTDKDKKEKSLYLLKENKESSLCQRLPGGETFLLDRKVSDNIFFISPEKFKDTRPFKFNAEDIKNIYITRGENTFHFTKNGTWKSSGAEKKEIPAILALLWELEELSYDSTSDKPGRSLYAISAKLKSNEIAFEFSIEKNQDDLIIVLKDKRYKITDEKIVDLIETVLKEVEAK